LLVQRGEEALAVRPGAGDAVFWPLAAKTSPAEDDRGDALLLVAQQRRFLFEASKRPLWLNQI
jgi:uncharacterized protein (UPF0548 family)